MAERISATYNAKDEDGNVTDTTTASVDYDFGDTLEEAVELVGAEVIFSLYKQSAIIKAQGQLRACLKAEQGEEEIESHFGTWKPGIAVARAPKDPKAEGRKAFEKMSSQERTEYLAELQEIVDQAG